MKINNINWKVEYAPLDCAFGETDFVSSAIRIEQNINKDLLEPTLMHEITHAYLFSYGFNTQKEFPLEQVCDIIGHNFKEFTRLKEIALKELEGENK